MIKKYTYLDGFTFEDIFKYVDQVLDLDAYTAKQIASIMEICKDQNEMGFDRAWKELQG